jgi:hypothetical protein
MKKCAVFNNRLDYTQLAVVSSTVARVSSKIIPHAEPQLFERDSEERRKL